MNIRPHTQIPLPGKSRAILAPSDKHHPPPWTRAFSRMELVAVLAALGLVALLALPVWAGFAPRSEQAICLNNLRRIGQAFHIWGNDHDDRLPVRVPLDQGGTQPSRLKTGNAWFEFAWISNELATPKILVCPSDTQTRRVAEDFSTRADGGFLHHNYRANALSYFLGLHSHPFFPRVVLAGDRHVRMDTVNVSCSARINNAAGARNASYYDSVVEWTNALHGKTGNLLFDDGQVQMTSSAGVRSQLGAGDGSSNSHYLMP